AVRAGCQAQAAEPTSPAALPPAAGDQAAAPPAVEPPAGAEPAQPDEPEPVANTYWVQPGVPYALAEQIVPLLEQAGLTPAAAPEDAMLAVEANPPADALLTARWVYALAAPFPTVPDDISWQSFTQYWLTGAADGLVGFDAPPQLVLSQDVADWLSAEVGPPAGGL